jgi:Tfp pilus assembly protein PilW
VIRAIRSRARGGDAQAGLSLVELLVASFISLLMLSLVGAMFVQITNLTANAQATKTATGVASTVMTEVAGVVRQGTQVTTAAGAIEGGVILGSTSDALIIDSFVDATVAAGQPTIAPTQVTLSVNSSGYLVEQRVAGTLSGGYYGFTSTPTSRTVNGASGLTVQYTYLAGSATVTPSSTGLTAAQAATVTAVTVTVTAVNTVSTGSDPVQLINQVTMPNIAIANGGS